MFSWLRGPGLNQDELQFELARHLTEAAATEIGLDIEASAGVALFVMSQPWSQKEAERRIAHALTLLAKVAPKEIHDRATRIGRKVVTEHLA